GGRVEVTGTRQGDDVVLRVADNGCGIAPDLLPTVFELFIQIQDRHRRERFQEGLGLGLALVRELVTLHGGTVEAHSEGLDRGSEFIVRLPAASPRGRVSATGTS